MGVPLGAEATEGEGGSGAGCEIDTMGSKRGVINFINFGGEGQRKARLSDAERSQKSHLPRARTREAQGVEGGREMHCPVAKCLAANAAMALRASGPLPAQGNGKLSGMVAHATLANLKGSYRKENLSK